MKTTQDHKIIIFELKNSLLKDLTFVRLIIKKTINTIKKTNEIIESITTDRIHWEIACSCLMKNKLIKNYKKDIKYITAAMT